MAEQSYANHAHTPTMTLIGAFFWLVAVVCIVLGWIGYADTTSYGLLALLAAVFLLLGISRVYTTALQDRIIRLEMRLRCEKLLAPEQYADFDRLTPAQIVALRFASDAELPALMTRALDEQLSSKAIKEAVQRWVPDFHRT
jgi:hypothetical protein